MKLAKEIIWTEWRQGWLSRLNTMPVCLLHWCLKWREICIYRSAAVGGWWGHSGPCAWFALMAIADGGVMGKARHSPPVTHWPYVWSVTEGTDVLIPSEIQIGKCILGNRDTEIVSSKEAGVERWKMVMFKSVDIDRWEQKVRQAQMKTVSVRMITSTIRLSELSGKKQNKTNKKKSGSNFSDRKKKRLWYTFYDEDLCLCLFSHAFIEHFFFLQFVFCVTFTYLLSFDMHFFFPTMYLMYFFFLTQKCNHSEQFCSQKMRESGGEREKSVHVIEHPVLNNKNCSII